MQLSGFHCISAIIRSALNALQWPLTLTPDIYVISCPSSKIRVLLDLSLQDLSYDTKHDHIPKTLKWDIWVKVNFDLFDLIDLFPLTHIFYYLDMFFW